jgi:hypothetical protein
MTTTFAAEPMREALMTAGSACPSRDRVPCFQRDEHRPDRHTDWGRDVLSECETGDAPFATYYSIAKDDGTVRSVSR